MTTIMFYVRQEGAARHALRLVHAIDNADHIPTEGDLVDIPVDGASSVRKVECRIWCWDSTPPTAELLLSDEPEPWPPWES